MDGTSANERVRAFLLGTALLAAAVMATFLLQPATGGSAEATTTYLPVAGAGGLVTDPAPESPWTIPLHHTPPPGVPPGPPSDTGSHGHGGGPSGPTADDLAARALANVGTKMADGLVHFAAIEEARRLAGTDVTLGQ
jgi:hypothetical protein